MVVGARNNTASARGRRIPRLFLVKCDFEKVAEFAIARCRATNPLCTAVVEKRRYHREQAAECWTENSVRLKYVYFEAEFAKVISAYAMPSVPHLGAELTGPPTVLPDSGTEGKHGPALAELCQHLGVRA